MQVFITFWKHLSQHYLTQRRTGRQASMLLHVTRALSRPYCTVPGGPVSNPWTWTPALLEPLGTSASVSITKWVAGLPVLAVWGYTSWQGSCCQPQDLVLDVSPTHTHLSSPTGISWLSGFWHTSGGAALIPVLLHTCTVLSGLLSRPHERSLALQSKLIKHFLCQKNENESGLQNDKNEVFVRKHLNNC